MEVKEYLKDGLTCQHFFVDGEEVGKIKIDFYEDDAFIFSIDSYKKGFGTKIINHVKSLDYVKTISGDISEGTEGFWLSVGAKIEQGEFEIVL